MVTEIQDCSHWFVSVSSGDSARGFLECIPEDDTLSPAYNKYKDAKKKKKQLLVVAVNDFGMKKLFVVTRYSFQLN